MVWQAFVRNWLQQKAREAIYEQMAAAREQAAGSGETPAPQPCDVGLVFALGIESGGLEDLLSDLVVTRGRGFTVRQGKLAGRSLVLMEAGIGRAAAARGAQLLIDGHRPSWIISAGFAGGLQPHVRRGDIVLVNQVAEPSGGCLSIDLRVNPASLAAGVHVGGLVTVEQVVATSAEKQVLGEKHGALAVDMETWGVAEVCRQAKIRFLAVRAISDALEDELPPEIGKLVRQKSTAGRLGAATAALWQRPGSAKDMLKLKQTAIEVSDRLAKFLSGVVTQLVPETNSIAERGIGNGE